LTSEVFCGAVITQKVAREKTHLELVFAVVEMDTEHLVGLAFNLVLPLWRVRNMRKKTHVRTCWRRAAGTTISVVRVSSSSAGRFIAIVAIICTVFPSCETRESTEWEEHRTTYSHVVGEDPALVVALLALEHPKIKTQWGTVRHGRLTTPLQSLGEAAGALQARAKGLFGYKTFTILIQKKEEGELPL
jgi:hypothetical protein